jgi:hypothetical protein
MRFVVMSLVALLSCSGAFPARAQTPELPPHSWLFGAWIGGMFPPPSVISPAACQAQPVVIFTRDLVLRGTFTSVTYTQREIETVRATATGAEFRFVAPVQPVAESGNLFPQPGAAPVVGFGCDSPNLLHVHRISENEISFPHCTDFPYPLIRCPG